MCVAHTKVVGTTAHSAGHRHARVSTAMVAGAVFAVAGGLVGVLYCVVVVEANSAAMAKYAQASAVSKVLALPIAACLMSEPVDLSRWRTNAGAALTVLAFVAR